MLIIKLHVLIYLGCHTILPCLKIQVCILDKLFMLTIFVNWLLGKTRPKIRLYLTYLRYQIALGCHLLIGWRTNRTHFRCADCSTLCGINSNQYLRGTLNNWMLGWWQKCLFNFSAFPYQGKILLYLILLEVITNAFSLFGYLSWWPYGWGLVNNNNIFDLITAQLEVHLKNEYFLILILE